MGLRRSENLSRFPHTLSPRPSYFPSPLESRRRKDSRQESGISDTEALLGFLHHNGVLFYRKELFQSQIILDQNWALEAINSILKCLEQLKKLHGRFSREDLELLIWSDYTHAEQEIFLGMMEGCGICFTCRMPPFDKIDASKHTHHRS